MATKSEVVSAITHIESLVHSENWRGGLNDEDYRALKSILDDHTPGETWVSDSLIGALRNQWPTLFDPKNGSELTPPADPSPAPPPPAEPSPAPPPAPAPAPPLPAPAAPVPGAAPAPSDGGGDQLSGQSADSIKQLDSALSHNHSALNDADVELTDAILAAKTADEQGKGQLDALKQSMIDQVRRIGPQALQTGAGMEELATYLQNKAADILNVMRNAHLDSQSQAKVMDALTARYSALEATNSQHQLTTPQQQPGGPGGAPPAGPGGAPAPGTPPGGPGAGGGEPQGLYGDDPLLGGGLLGGLPGALTPALGAAAGIPAALGSAIPGGGGLGDLGSALGSALHDARDTDSDDRGDEHKDHHGAAPGSAGGARSDEHQSNNAGGQGQSPPVAGPGQPPPPVAQDQTVDVKGLGPIKVDHPALAAAARQVVAGGNLHDEYNRANIAIPPPGTPVMAPISPGKTAFGDVGQYTNKQIMALGGQKAWVDGQVLDFDKIDFGPGFLGWIHPSMPVPATPAPVTTPPPVLSAPESPQSGLPGAGSQY